MTTSREKTQTTPRVLTATATRRGIGSDNADGVYVHATAAGPLSVAIVDMTGHGDGSTCSATRSPPWPPRSSLRWLKRWPRNSASTTTRQ
jgi:hypothetical protein